MAQETDIFPITLSPPPPHLFFSELLSSSPDGLGAWGSPDPFCDWPKAFSVLSDSVTQNLLEELVS